MTDWWLSRGSGAPEGPFPGQALVQDLTEGRVSGRAYVCRVGEQRWLRVTQVDELWNVAFPEQVALRAEEQRVLTKAAELESHVLLDEDSWDHDDARTLVLTPVPILSAAGQARAPATPVPRLPTPPPRPLTQPLADPPLAVRNKIPTLDGITNSQPPSADPKPASKDAAPALTAGALSGSSRPAPGRGSTITEPRATPARAGSGSSAPPRGSDAPAAAASGLAGVLASSRPSVHKLTLGSLSSKPAKASGFGVAALPRPPSIPSAPALPRIELTPTAAETTPQEPVRENPRLAEADADENEEQTRVLVTESVAPALSQQKQAAPVKRPPTPVTSNKIPMGAGPDGSVSAQTAPLTKAASGAPPRPQPPVPPAIKLQAPSRQSNPPVAGTSVRPTTSAAPAQHSPKGPNLAAPPVPTLPKPENTRSTAATVSASPPSSATTPSNPLAQVPARANHPAPSAATLLRDGETDNDQDLPTIRLEAKGAHLSVPAPSPPAVPALSGSASPAAAKDSSRAGSDLVPQAQGADGAPREPASHQASPVPIPDDDDPAELMEADADDNSQPVRPPGPRPLALEPSDHASRSNRPAAAPPAVRPIISHPPRPSTQPQAPSIVLQHQPLIQQEATKPALRALRAPGVVQVTYGSLVIGALVLVLLVLIALAAVLFVK